MTPNATFLLLFLTCAVASSFLLLALLIDRRQRRRAFALLAERRGWDYAPVPRDVNLPHIAPLEFLGSGMQRYMRNYLRGALNGCDFILFDLKYLHRFGDESEDTVFLAWDNSMRLPKFCIRPKTLLSWSAVFHRPANRQFDAATGADCLQDYLLYGDAPSVVRGYLLEPAVRAILEERSGNLLEANRNAFLLCKQGAQPSTADELEALVERGVRIHLAWSAEKTCSDCGLVL